MGVSSLLSLLLGLLFFCGGFSCLSPSKDGGSLSTRSDSSDTIGYLAHSWNDLDEWMPMLKKGVTQAKIDPHYKNLSWCVSANQTMQSVPYGCFPLIHNSPLGGVPYNTTDDVLDLLGDQAYRRFFQRPQRFFISMCLKIDNPAAEFSNWTKLFTQFYHRANALVKKHQLNVEFILDGHAQQALEKDPLLFDGWVSTWTPFRGPWDALVSNDVSRGYQRYQVLDPPLVGFAEDPVLDVQLFAAIDYGKFSSSSYPIYFWEPIDQSDILDASHAYLSGGTLHPPGFRFASNEDPAMFQVYAASVTGVGWNVEVPHSSGLSRPRLTAFVPRPSMRGPTNPRNVAILHTSWNEAMGESLYSVWSASQVSMGPINHTDGPMMRFPQPLSHVPLDGVSTAHLGNAQYLLAFASSPIGSHRPNTTYALYRYDPVVGSLSSSLVRHNVSKRTLSLVQFDPQGNTSAQLYIISASSDGANGTCYLALQMWSIDGDSFDVNTSFPTQCIVPSGSHDMASLSVAMAFDASKREAAGLVTYSIACGAGNASWCTHAVHIGVDVHSGIVRAGPRVLGASATQVVPVLIGMGSQSTLSAAVSGPVVLMAEVRTHSFCYNNNYQNKRAGTKVCHSVPRNEPQVLSYSYGELSRWMEHMDGCAASMLGAECFISSCNAHIMHGAYDEGTWPSVHVMAHPNGPQGRFAWMEMHQGVDKSYKDPATCGRPSISDALVLDSFILPRFPLG